MRKFDNFQKVVKFSARPKLYLAFFGQVFKYLTFDTTPEAALKEFGSASPKKTRGLQMDCTEMVLVFRHLQLPESSFRFCTANYNLASYFSSSLLSQPLRATTPAFPAAPPAPWADAGNVPAQPVPQRF